MEWNRLKLTSRNSPDTGLTSGKDDHLRNLDVRLPRCGKDHAFRNILARQRRGRQALVHGISLALITQSH